MFGVECFSDTDFNVNLLQEAIKCMQQGDALANPTTGEPHHVSYIHLASWWNNQQLLEFLIKCNLDVNYQDPNGRTALMVATQRGNISEIECLLRCGASVNLQTQSGVTAIGYAMHFENKAIIEKYVEYRAVVDMPDGNGNTLLHNSCSSGNYTDVVEIEQLGADIDQQNHAGKTPIMIACERGHLTIAKYLVSRGCNLKARCNECFSVENYAFFSDCPDTIEYIRKKSTTLSYDNGLKLIKACQNHNLFEVTQLLEQNEDPNFKHPEDHWSSPILVACESRNLKIIEKLFEYGANVNSKNDQGRTPLMTVCLSGQTNCVAYLLDVGANPNLRDIKGITPLMCAAQNGFQDVAQLLVSKGALLSQKSDTGWSPLAYAANNRHTNIVRLLLETMQVNVNIKDDYGMTCLFLASQNGDIETVNLLLMWHADVNINDFENKTPLMIAAMGNHEQTVRVLVEHKAEMDLVQIQGLDALDLARNCGHTNIVKYLRQVMQLASLERTAIAGENCCITSVSEREKTHKAEKVLLDMCEQGWAFHDSIKFVVDQGANINCRNRDGMTPILLACARNHLGYIPWLIQYGTDINCQDHDQWSPLMYGVKHHDLSAIHVLLENGADVNMQNSEGKTALMLAIERKRVDVIERLLKEGVNIQCQDKQGDTVVMYCKKYLAEEHNHISRILLDKNCPHDHPSAVTHRRGNSSNTDCTKHDYDLQFLEACTEGNTANMHMLAAKYQEYSPELIQKCLTVLVLNHHRDAMLMLKSIGIGIGMEFGNGENVLFEAVRMKDHSMVETLVSSRLLDVGHRNKEGLTATMVAVHEGKVSLVSYLLSVERSVHCGVGDCEAILLALKRGMYQLFIDDEECRPYDKTCKYCTNANQTEYILL